MIKKNKKLYPKVLISAFGLFVILLISLSFIKKTKEDEITKTYLNFSSPIFKPDATYYLYLDSVAVIDYKNYALYEFEDIRTLQNDTILIEKTIVCRYFLLKKKELYGYYYDSIDDKTGKRARMDSLLTKRAFYGQSHFISSIMELIDSQKNKEGYNLVEKYKCKTKVDISYPDTVIVYYGNKFKDISFTLSKELDSIKKMKVQKTRAIYNPQFIKGYPNEFPSYEYKFELKSDTVANLEKYKRFIEDKTKIKQ